MSKLHKQARIFIECALADDYEQSEQSENVAKFLYKLINQDETCQRNVVVNIIRSLKLLRLK